MPLRHCNGGPHAEDAGGEGWCGCVATVVCTAPDGLRWYACDELAHREGAEGANVEPIGEFFAKVFAGR